LAQGAHQLRAASCSARGGSLVLQSLGQSAMMLFGWPRDRVVTSAAAAMPVAGAPPAAHRLPWQPALVQGSGRRPCSAVAVALVATAAAPSRRRRQVAAAAVDASSTQVAPRRRRRRRIDVESSESLVETPSASSTDLLADCEALENRKVPTCDCEHVLSTMVEVEDVLTGSECQILIDAAEKRASSSGGWGETGHAVAATKDVKVWNLGVVAERLVRNEVFGTLRPIIAEQFKLDEEEIVIDDAFVAKYSLGRGQQRNLAWHRDGSIVSAIFSLSDSDDYAGGGTIFKDGSMYRTERGAGIIFAGQRMHGGITITGGTRYILTLFLKCADLSCRDLAVAMEPVSEGSEELNKVFEVLQDKSGLGKVRGLFGF